MASCRHQEVSEEARLNAVQSGSKFPNTGATFAKELREATQAAPYVGLIYTTYGVNLVGIESIETAKLVPMTNAMVAQKDKAQAKQTTERWTVHNKDDVDFARLRLHPFQCDIRT